MFKEFRRWQIENTQRSLKNRRVITISGARQTGKTTLTKQVMGNTGIFRSLDNNAFLKAAIGEPDEFVKNPKGTMIIDEIQKAPSLLSEIKLAVDSNNRNGQYLITGSANIQTLANIDDSLAGRIRHIRLRTLSIGETLGNPPTFLKNAFAKKFPIQIKGYDKNAIFDLAFRGGYPEAVRIKNAKERKEWHKDYLNNLLKKDLYDIENIRRLDVVKDLVKILAAWSSKYMDKAKIGSTLEISRPTIDIYTNALEALFIFERVPPYTKTDYDLVGRKSKIFATDTGLMTSILNWKKNEVMLNHDRAGKLMETFVFCELAAQIDLDSDCTLYQYRDVKQREIDFLIEKEDEGIIGIEVKAGRNISKDDFASQIWFKKNIVKGRLPYIGYVLYSGEDTLSFGNDMIAIPMATLWKTG
ncbi:MAG: ATP-binding protein [Termitinemataceae bacterium]|nr:MAG: ATP-binding protein [Termitinemataceae bacterium]